MIGDFIQYLDLKSLFYSNIVEAYPCYYVQFLYISLLTIRAEDFCT